MLQAIEFLLERLEKRPGHMLAIRMAKDRAQNLDPAVLDATWLGAFWGLSESIIAEVGLAPSPTRQKMREIVFDRFAGSCEAIGAGDHSVGALRAMVEFGCSVAMQKPGDDKQDREWICARILEAALPDGEEPDGKSVEILREALQLHVRLSRTIVTTILKARGTIED